MPIWFVRKLPVDDGVRVMKWLDEGSPIPMHALDKWVSFDDDTPVHPTIYLGGSGDLERYWSMAEQN